MARSPAIINSGSTERKKIIWALRACHFMVGTTLTGSRPFRTARCAERVPRWAKADYYRKSLGIIQSCDTEKHHSRSRSPQMSTFWAASFGEWNEDG
jgi:hypothetical protein